MSKNTWQVLRKGAMLKGSSVTVTEDLSRWAWHLLFSVQLRENNLWKFTCWWDFVCCCWSVKVKIEHVAKVKVLMSGVFDNVEQSSESSCAMSKRGTLLPRCYLLLSQFPLCQSPSCTVLQSSKMKWFLQVHLQYDKLYVDGKCFVWNDHRGKVTNPESFVWYPFGKHTYFAMVTTIMIIPT